LEVCIFLRCELDLGLGYGGLGIADVVEKMPEATFSGTV
jgi:hypothetical protein